MKKTIVQMLALTFGAITIVGCASPSGSQDAGIIGNIPADTKFAKVSIGMSMKETYDLIGAPTDSKVYTTGKAWIPFYFGSDGARCEALYKGEGRITFTGRGYLKVYRIIYDATETGYNR